jgi:hypothetical protein
LIDADTRRQTTESLLTDLVHARAELVGVHLRTIKQIMAARSALGIASVAGYGPGTMCFAGAEGAQLTVAELADLVKELATNEDRVRNLIAEVDARVTSILKSMPGELH